ncbi:MAG: ribosome recycling factor [Flavobacteriaceae bacterium]|jgi:ribosome recycling factor
MFNEFKKELEKTQEWLSLEYTNVRTGRATPLILDSVMVDVYGAKSPIKNNAAVTIEGPKSLLVSPWDKSITGEIERAIREADLGLSVSAGDGGVRVHFPELTEESRGKLARVLKEKLEDARVSVRKARDEMWEGIQEKEKNGEMTEDERFRAKEEMQKYVDESNKVLEETFKKKEVEVLAI